MVMIALVGVVSVLSTPRLAGSVDAACSGNPHDYDSGPNGNPHDLVSDFHHHGAEPRPGAK